MIGSRQANTKPTPLQISSKFLKNSKRTTYRAIAASRASSVISPANTLRRAIRLQTCAKLFSANSNTKADASQHTGLGKRLVFEAEKIVRQKLTGGVTPPLLAVISGVGVRDYYRALGYRLKKTYVVKKLT